ncbi:small G protein signaling modulator 1 [Trichomycterus rosablanca]|uniref:small G protein signaling modulator 1 n=1 Tax=Trichomycterus rosablanca TaxID=2290929 RepID=UPI002F3575D1
MGFVYLAEAETRQRLLRSVKKEVKQIMEEAVTRKFVHEDSSHIISFCGVVEACVLHGLKRRAAGFLRSNKLAALFLKVGKVFTPAEDLCKKVQELEQIIENNSRQSQSQASQDSIRKQPQSANLSPQAIKHLWIRTALTEKVLDKIVLYLVENSSKFYERDALLRDPVDGPILASLLVGPCALEYTKAKTANHFWTDPSADELVQRHRIHSGHCRQDSPTKRPALIQKRQSSGSMDDRPSLWARDYVESLHQNSRATLLFGKNNVLVQPTDDMEAIPGYLSLHQTAELMTLKWTPNQLMNGNVEFDYEKSVYWDYAMTIRLEEIVYLHCHQQVDSGGTVVLVSQDGIQRPPFRFPKGGHLLQFLTCLETGLLPHGQLDPPLWSQRGKGKVFPKLRKRSPHGSCESFSDKDDDEATDYVFRIIYPGSQEFVAPELIDPAMSMWQPAPRKSSCSSCSQNGSTDGGLLNGCNHDRAPLKLLCETMKYQIISRAFYGWLAYCRHLSTVRTHLSALVNSTIIEPDIPYDAREGLSEKVWKTFLQDSSTYEEAELLRLVYYGGVNPNLRKEVWPFLLGHYQFTMTLSKRKEVDEQVRASYEQTMSEWLGCEAIVRQREKEQHAAALAKCASGASVDLRQDSTISTDSSQSCSSSEKQSNACSQSDSNCSTQVFGSVDEVDPIESEPKPKEEKPQPKIPNGALPNCTSSPDSGHPSSRNFSVTSGLSDCSPSTEEASTQESGTKNTPPEPLAVTSDEHPKICTLENNLKEEQAEQTLPALNADNQFTSKEDLELGKKDQDIANRNQVTVKGDTDTAKKDVDLQKDNLCTAKEDNDKSKEDPESGNKELDTAKEDSVPAKGHVGKEDVDSSKNCIHKLHTGDLPAEDEIIKPQENHKYSENSDSKEVSRTDMVKSIDSSEKTLNSNETFVQNVIVANTPLKIQQCEQPETEEKQPINSKEKSAGENDSLEEGIKDLLMLTETQQNIQSGVDKVELVSKQAAHLEMQLNTEPTGKDDPPRALTNEECMEKDKNSDTLKPEDERELSKSEITSEPHMDPSKTESKLAQPSVLQGLELINPSDADKSSVQSLINWPSDPNRTNPFIKQMTEPVSESCISMMCYSKQSPDTSDDSPSALEMEEIPAALVYMPTENILAKPPITLDPPPLALSIPPERAAIVMPAPELSVEAGLNTSPEVTESVLSEEEPEMDSLFPKPESLAVGGEHKNDVTSPVSSIGTTYSQELLDLYTLNLHRIDKDVQRCDRNYWYFTTANLEKLRNIMCSYVWQHLDIGYVQGMCDLLAPLLVILDDEALAFSCFTELMKRMNQNFPHGGAMDTHFANMRSLIQILDSELYELMQQNGDYTHFYFCYRWFLLDFKREMVYDDVFSLWETIWAARTISSGHFVLFIALALVELYRDIILENNMDFTDIIKFFNEMAERHDVPKLLVMARDLVHKVQILIENK